MCACLCGITRFLQGLEVGQILPGGLVRGGTERAQMIRVRSERPDNGYLLRLTSPPTRLLQKWQNCVCADQLFMV